MLVGLMINYHDARMTDNKLPRCQMTATPVTGISTKCQCRDQNSGSPRVHGPGIKEVKWSVEVQGKARGSLGQGPLLLGGITTPPSTTPPPLPDMPTSPSLTCHPLPTPLDYWSRLWDQRVICPGVPTPEGGATTLPSTSLLTRPATLYLPPRQSGAWESDGILDKRST